MALQTDFGRRIPDGVIRLSKEEALHHQRTVIKEWPSESEVAFVRYGGFITAAANLASSGIIVNYFRNYLKIPVKSSLATVFPAVILPSVVGYMTSDRILTQNTLLMTLDCPICVQMKFAFCQFHTAILFPAAYSCVSYAKKASEIKSYPIPELKKDASKFWKIYFGVLKESTRNIHTVGLIQTVLVLFLPYLQNKQFYTVMDKLREKENSVKDSNSVNSGAVS